MLNSSFLDYRMPTALDVPNIDTIIVEVPNPGHPYGVRGVGEVPIVPPLAAIANAIHDATGAPLHVAADVAAQGRWRRSTGWSEPLASVVALSRCRWVIERGVMGPTYVDAVLRGPTGREASVRLLLDSGATYSWCPLMFGAIYELQPSRTVTTILARRDHDRP